MQGYIQISVFLCIFLYTKKGVCRQNCLQCLSFEVFMVL
jgi:hypothetical protein